jgi:two-component system, NtrC family, sensor histidine kinase HydH
MEEQIHLQERRERQLAALHELWRAMPQVEARRLLTMIVERATGALDAHTGSLLLRDRGSDTLRVTASVGLPWDVSESLTLLVGERIAGRVAASGQAILVPSDPRSHPLLATQDNTTGEMIGTRPEIASALCAPITAPDGNVIGVLCLSRPAPAKSFTEADLRMATLFAAQAGAFIAYRHIQEDGVRQASLVAIGQMGATVAHELRNPLGAIKGAAQFLEKQMRLGQITPEAATDLLQIISDEVDGLGQLTTNLLEFAKPMALSCSTQDLAEIIENETEFLRDELTRIGVLDLHLFLEKPAIAHIDALQLGRAVRNILINAAQAVASVANSRAEGSVTIRLATLEESDVSDMGDRASWCLTISDNGPGIPETVLHQLFEPFFTTKARGTGLGLAQVRQTIEAHEGTIEAQNRPEGGAMFTITLPKLEN